MFSAHTNLRDVSSFELCTFERSQIVRVPENEEQTTVTPAREWKEIKVGTSYSGVECRGYARESNCREIVVDQAINDDGREEPAKGQWVSRKSETSAKCARSTT